MVALFNYLALIGTFLSASLVLPAFVGFGTGDVDIGFTLLFYASMGGFLSLSVLAATRGRPIVLGRVNSVYLAVISWLFFPLVIAIPVADIFSISYLDAIFEAVSAFTTTAADGIRNTESVSKAGIFFRANLQWVGGLATLLTFVLFLGPIRAGGMPKPRNSIGEASARTTSSINRIALSVFRYFIAASIICFALLMLSGTSAFDALILSSTAITAGGYLPGSGDLETYATPAALYVMAFFFLFASTNIYWHRMIGRWQILQLKAHRESYYLIAGVFVLAFVFLIGIVDAAGSGGRLDVDLAASEAFFNSASLFSTSGLQSRAGIFALLTPSLVFAILLIGGGCYSVAGGIKFYRLGGMLFHAGNDLAKLVYPHSIPKAHFGSEDYSLRLLKSIWVMFVSVLGIVALGAVCLALTGMAFQASLTASIAAISNAGPAYSVDWVPRGTEGWPAYADMVISQKMILCAIMLFGRLEVIALLVALNPVYWLRQ